MIKLDIMGKCQNCPEFEAKTESSILYGDFGVVEKETIITCKHRSMCDSIQKYLEKSEKAG